MESLEDLENTVVERLKAQNRSKSLIKQLSPIPPARQSKQNTPQITKSFFETTKLGKNVQAKRPLGKTFLNIMPGLFSTGSSGSIDKPTPGLAIKRSISIGDDSTPYKYNPFF